MSYRIPTIIRNIIKKLYKPKPEQQVAITQTSDYVIFYATQRGRAKTIAQQTQTELQKQNISVELFPLKSIKPKELTHYSQCLIITSTFGSGQAPEDTRKFERLLMKTNCDLSKLSFAVLALGDRNFDRFCGFGSRLNHWLIQCNGQAIQNIIRVNQMEQQTIDQWFSFVNNLKKAHLHPDNNEVLKDNHAN